MIFFLILFKKNQYMIWNVCSESKHVWNCPNHIKSWIFLNMGESNQLKSWYLKHIGESNQIKLWLLKHQGTKSNQIMHWIIRTKSNQIISFERKSDLIYSNQNWFWFCLTLLSTIVLLSVIFLYFIYSSPYYVVPE